MLREWFGNLRGWLTGRQILLAPPDPLRSASQAAHAPARRAPPASPPVAPERAVRMAERTRTLAIRLFGAHQPVDSPRDLFGRQGELDSLTGAVIDSHMHAVIYGPRGSGKTSLVRVFGDLADARGVSVIYLSCAGGGDFGELMLPYLDEIGPATFGMRADDFAHAMALVRTAPTPRSVATMLARVEREDVILILDEFDRLEDKATKGQIALLIKLLSDMRSRVRLIFVGISGDVGDLIDVHASVRRHILAVGLTPIADDDVERFIQTTSQAIGLQFDDEALALLRWLVCGSPYHMRLLSLHSCLCAIERDHRFADTDTVLAGVVRAREIWRETNLRDEALFASLVREGRFPLAAIEAFAQTAAMRLEFTPDDLTRALAGAGIDPAIMPQLIEALSPALGRLDEGAARLAFEDVLAPQFLLTFCAAERSANQTGPARIIKGEGR